MLAFRTESFITCMIRWNKQVRLRYELLAMRMTCVILGIIIVLSQIGFLLEKIMPKTENNQII